MRFLEDLENMESDVEKSNGENKIESYVETTSEDKIKNNLYTLDDFYSMCDDIKNNLYTLTELEMIGEDTNEAKKVILDSFVKLMNAGRAKFNLSDSDIGSIKDYIFDKKNGKVR